MQPDHVLWNHDPVDLARSGIYRITHVPTNREYVGSSKCFAERWREHLDQLRHHRHGNKRLERSWHFHGEAQFVFEIIEFVDDLTMLIEREQWYLDTRLPYYNLCPTAGNLLGYRHRASSRQKMSQSAKRQRKHRSIAQQAYYDRLHTPSPKLREWHQRQRGLPKKQPLTPAQLAALHRGAHMSKPLTPEGRAHLDKIREIGVAKRRGVTNTPEHRAKISESCKASFASFPPEKQESLKTQARANQLAYAKRKHEAGLVRQQAIWATLTELGWVPNVPYNSWQAAAILRERHPELSQSRISEFLRWWERDGKLKLGQGNDAHHPTPTPSIPPPSLTQLPLFQEDAS